MSNGQAFLSWVSDLAQTHTRSMVSYARLQGLASQDALEAVQDAFVTFLQLPQARDLVKSEEDSRAFLTVIVRNAARNLRRRNERHASRSGPETLDSEVSSLPSGDELAARAEDHVQLVGCLNRLGRVQRQVVVLRFLEELSGADVAAQLDVPPGHVAVLLHRAKRNLLECIGAASA